MKMRDLLDKIDSINTPVNEQATMNVSMTADHCDEVGELMKLMNNMGINTKPISAAQIDDPKNPGKDDDPDDVDLKAGALGGAAGAYGGSVLGNMVAPGPVGTIIGGTLGGLAGDAITGDGII
tara:strand:- start:567 stop:935 length:369 start_codon:yes stop_codon:yes gene_type:complete